MMIPYSNFIIILSSPSGAGKSTITKKLLETDENIKLSVSATTREPRDGEEDGKHYYFLSKDTFKEEIEKDNFVEYAEVFGNYYGTLKREVESKFADNKDIILDIDWQGARQVSDQLDVKRLLRIFILPSANSFSNAFTSAALRARLKYSMRTGNSLSRSVNVR